MNDSYKVAVVQAAPVFMNLDSSIDKAIGLIEQASRAGARLIAFPECWLPGYPWWAWLNATAYNMRYFQQYHQNSLVVGSPAFERLSDAARRNNIFLSMGFSERDHGSLYIAQALFDNTGALVQARRKLKPTHMERTIYGDGDGSHFGVFDTELGKVGQLCCWEHLQPLTKYAMYSMHEQVHISAWPSFSLYDGAYALSPQISAAITQTYAIEGQCFVLSPCALVSQDMYDLLVENDQQAELISVGGGYAQIYGPDGRPLCEPLPETEEGLLLADIDLSEIALVKSFADPVGHYSRPDVTRLLLNRCPQAKVEEFTPELMEEVIASADALGDEQLIAS